MIWFYRGFRALGFDLLVSGSWARASGHWRLWALGLLPGFERQHWYGLGLFGVSGFGRRFRRKETI